MRTSVVLLKRVNLTLAQRAWKISNLWAYPGRTPETRVSMSCQRLRNKPTRSEYCDVPRAYSSIVSNPRLRRMPRAAANCWRTPGVLLKHAFSFHHHACAICLHDQQIVGVPRGTPLEARTCITSIVASAFETRCFIERASTLPQHTISWRKKRKGTPGVL